MVRYLDRAWADWEATMTAPEAIPDTVLHPALREGMGELPTQTHPLGRLGEWCFETMTPIGPGTIRAARAAVDVALTGADLVLAGSRLVYGLCRPPGHHSPRAAFGGYCYFNNAAIAAEWLVSAGRVRVAIVDVDVHHGNGTQQIFYRRGDVQYVSLHGDPARTYPYFAGFAEETGAGPGAGATLNVPLPAGCDDEAYLAALDLVLERVAAFAPEVIVVSLGLDTYHLDPLGDLALTTAGYEAIGARVASLRVPMLVVQEGGYHVPDLGRNAVSWLRGAAGPMG
jgi:acetoin utilization deacetylase AcuC-like enzyme